MKINADIKNMGTLLCTVLFFMVSCEKKINTPEELPMVNYSFWIYDSVEGTADVTHFNINRSLEIQYDPNVDKCYMENWFYTRLDTFDRSPHWKRGYVHRTDFFHRIIFNGDTITIHHNVQNQIGETGFRYVQGVKQ